MNAHEPPLRGSVYFDTPVTCAFNRRYEPPNERGKPPHPWYGFHQQCHGRLAVCAGLQHRGRLACLHWFTTPEPPSPWSGLHQHYHVPASIYATLFDGRVQATAHGLIYINISVQCSSIRAAQTDRRASKPPLRFGSPQQTAGTIVNRIIESNSYGIIYYPPRSNLQWRFSSRLLKSNRRLGNSLHLSDHSRFTSVRELERSPVKNPAQGNSVSRNIRFSKPVQEESTSCKFKALKKV